MIPGQNRFRRDAPAGGSKLRANSQNHTDPSGAKVDNRIPVGAML